MNRAGANVSTMPTSSPPTTAPLIESNPPTHAAAKPNSSTAAMKLKSRTLRYWAMIAPAMAPMPAASAHPSISIRFTGMPTISADSALAATAR